MKKVLAFDIGGTNTRLALINEKFEVEKRIDYPTVTGSNEKFMENCYKILSEFPLENVVAIGAGVPGVVDTKNGRIIDLPNVGIKNVEFGKLITKKFGLPVFLRNDAEIACLGEAYLGAGQSYNSCFFVTISTGIGGALCIDKKIQNYPFEIGHTLLNYKGGYYEYEGLASGSHIYKLSELNNLKGYKTTRELFDGVRKGEKEAKILYKEWFGIIDSFIKLIVNSYHPEVICITGGVMKSKDIFFKKLQDNNPDANIVECMYSESAGIMGSGVYALQCAKIIWFLLIIDIYYY